MSDGGSGRRGRVEGKLKKDERSERHISSGLRRSDSVKRLCRKRKRKGKGMGRSSRGGKGQGGGGSEAKLFSFSDISNCCDASEGKLINYF